MKKSEKIIAGILIVIVLIGAWFFITRNSLIKSQENIQEQIGNIDTELQARLDKIPNLMNSVQGFMDHESETYKEISALRSGITPYVVEENGKIKAKSDLTEEEKIALEENSADLVNQLRVTVESYPELKETLMVGFMDELAGTENTIKQARREYNKLVRDYNNKVKLFPTSIVAKMSGFEEMEYYKANENAKDAPTVKFE